MTRRQTTARERSRFILQAVRGASGSADSESSERAAAPRLVRVAVGPGSLRRDTRAALGVPGILLTAAVVGATALPVANVSLKAERDRMEQAAASAGIAATRTMREAGEGLQAEELRRKADLYARLNLLDLPPAGRRKALETLEMTLETDQAHQRVTVDLAAQLPGQSIVQALMIAPTGGGGAAMPRMTRGTSTVECVADRLELVLAIDMTSSMLSHMHEPDKDMSEWSRRRDAALDAAQLMVDDIRSQCSDIELVVGIVPWAHTVRVPAGATERWRKNDWIDDTQFDLKSASQDRWTGCLEDRLMDTATKREDSLGLSAAVPADAAFPPYVYPDTELHTRRTEWGQAIARFVREQEASGRKVPAGDAKTLAENLRGDNDWNRDGGPNEGCIEAGMVPLRILGEDDDWFEDALAGLRAASLPGEGTMAHLGVTWARRMMSPAWDEVWDAEPTKAGGKAEDEGVRQILVLLSDGENGIKQVDPQDTIPGKSKICLAQDPVTFQPMLAMPGQGGMPIACTTLETAVVTGYSALGRNGPGAAADGHRTDMAHLTAAAGNMLMSRIPESLSERSRTFLDELLTTSCDAARRGRIHIYAVSLTSGTSSNAHQNATLQSCAGTEESPGAEEYFFEVTNSQKIEDAFRKIGEEISRIRRVS